MIRFLNVYYPTRTVILLLCEAIIVGGCFLLATIIRLGPDAYLALNYEQGYFKIAVITALSLVLSYYFDLYEPQIVSAPLEIYFRILLVLGFDCFLLSALILFFPGVAIAQYVYALAFLFLTPALISWRRLYEWVSGKRLFRERVYVLGAGDYASSIVTNLRARRELGMEVTEWQDIRLLDKAARKQIWIDELARLSAAKKSTVHRIIVAVEDPRDELPVQELLNIRFSGINVENATDLHERLSGKIQLSGVRPSNFLYSDGFRINRSQQFIRQLLSMLVATALLLLFLPFFPIVVLCIRLPSKGPIFFRQRRVGVGSQPFHMYKFRSMYTDAESGGARWATKNDPRVTRFGMFMRKTRIDEIPQLWNILKGDMGFVGPRPERPEFVPMLSEHLPFYYLRHLIRPGLTGWAQVRFGYGATLAEAREKLEYDLYYVKHMSLGLDLLIMFETVKTILRRRGAQ